MRLQPKAVSVDIRPTGNPRRPIRLVIGHDFVFDLSSADAVRLADRLVDATETKETE